MKRLIDYLFQNLTVWHVDPYSPRMRRKQNGKWEYRAMTEQEEREWVSESAW